MYWQLFQQNQNSFTATNTNTHTKINTKTNENGKTNTNTNALAIIPTETEKRFQIFMVFMRPKHNFCIRIPKKVANSLILDQLMTEDLDAFEHNIVQSRSFPRQNGSCIEGRERICHGISPSHGSPITAHFCLISTN